VETVPVPSKHYTDSGYHGSTEDEMERDVPNALQSRRSSPLQETAQGEPMGERAEQPAITGSAERRTTEGSFHSAREDMTAKVSFTVAERREDGNACQQERLDTEKSGPEAADAEDIHDHVMDVITEADRRPDLAQELDDIGSPSDGSTPDRPLVRKSSLTFASLPAREPLTNKKSFGARESRTSHLDQARNGRSSYFGKQAIGAQLPSMEFPTPGQLDQIMSDVDDYTEDHTKDAHLVAAQAHSQTSTQRLHEKIDMLGKSQTSRPSRPVPLAAVIAASNLKKSEAALVAEKEVATIQAVLENGADEEDDWIKPLETAGKHERPTLTKSHTTDVMENIMGDEMEDEDDEMEFDVRAPELIAHEERTRTPVRMSPSPAQMLPGFAHAKSASTTTLVSPEKAAMAYGPGHMKSISVSNPPYPSTTPKGSPRRIFDAPLTASKSKLQSIMKTAKGLFTSSAGASAAAKMETLSPKALRMAADNMPGLYPNISGMLEDKPLPPSPAKEARRTRSSTEREKEEKRKERELKLRQKAEDQLEKAREKEKQNAAQFKADEKMAQAQAQAQSLRPLPPVRQSPRRHAEEQVEVERQNDSHDMPPPAVPSLQSKAQRPGKPSRELPKKNRPQPMSIRVASQRMPVTTTSLASSLQETLPPATTKPNMISKKTSNASLNSAVSNTGFKSSVTSQAGKPRAVLAAERKKEADEREAQRKLEQKRDGERKRAAQQDEARRQEQRQRAEAERKERERIAAEQAKKNAQQQAIDKRRQEQARKMEQQRNVNAANEFVSFCLSFFYPMHDDGADPIRLRSRKTGHLPHNELR
jgi:hypothetical protein